MENCAVCWKEYNSFDPAAHPPTCSKICFDLWISVINHKGTTCWVPDCMEVYCGIRTPGRCQECEVFKIEEEIRKRGLNKDVIIGNY